ncbi:hypothetical protein BU15DRAFT_60660 [Melanogaster broomeanus]|nr:hypothetical protein BU15DRAFT_60660 [Melanogaster broomeanus]
MGVNQVMNGLTKEEVQEAERQAEEWRKAKPPPEVQARTALQKGERYCSGVHQRWKYAKKAMGDTRSGDEDRPSNTKDKAWIVDIKDASLEVMKQMIQGFITFHYSYITAKYLPEAVKLREPSKLQKKDVIAILEFCRKRQRSDPEDVFSFKKWQDLTGTLQNSVDSDSDHEAAI